MEAPRLRSRRVNPPPPIPDLTSPLLWGCPYPVSHTSQNSLSPPYLPPPPQHPPHPPAPPPYKYLPSPLLFLIIINMPSPSSPPPHPLSPKPDPDPDPQPQPLAIATLTPSVTVTLTDSNPDSHLADPPMGVPLLMPSSQQPSQTPPSASSRRLPPPCWTPEETSVLIDAYRIKWYDLRRGNLRAAHWEDVAADINTHCPDVLPPKTAVQCRHKMEKLRKRYRAELLRAKSIPHHRFSSSWVYFHKMDSMEKGTSPTPMVALPPPPAVNFNYNTSAGGGGGYEDLYAEDDDDDVFAVRGYQQLRPEYQRNGLKIKIGGDPKRGYPDIDESPNPNPNPNYGYAQRSGGSGSGGGYMMTPPPPFDEEMRYRMMKNGSSDGNVMLMKKKKRKMGSVNSGVGVGLREEKTREEEEEGREKVEDAALEMVEAIRVLGEGFVRVERMKMEMMRETERKRMEMEMARTQMLLQSQHRMVEAFAKSWSDILKDKDDTS